MPFAVEDNTLRDDPNLVRSKLARTDMEAVKNLDMTHRIGT